MQVQIAVVATCRTSETLAVRLIERALAHLDYPVTVSGPQPDPTASQMSNLVTDARAAGITFRIV